MASKNPIVEVIITAVNRSKKVFTDARKGVEDYGKAAKETNEKNKDFNDGLKALAGKAAMVAGAIVAAGAAVKVAFDFAEEGAKINRLGQSFDDLSNSYGKDSNEILSALQRASQGSIKNTDLMLSANRAMMLGVTKDADKMAKLLEIAAFKGRAMGLSTQQAFNDIVTGIGRASPMILDNLGIVVDSKKNYAEYAAQLGKSAQELTKVEQREALLTAVLKEGNTQLDAAGGLAKDDATSFEHLRASFGNAADEAKSNLAPALASVAEALADGFDRGSLFREKVDEISESMSWWQMQTEGYARAQAFADGIQRELNSDIDSATASYIAYGESLLVVNDATEQSVDVNTRLRGTYNDLLGTVQDIGGAIDSYNEKQDTTIEKRDELQSKINGLLEQGYWPESQMLQDLQGDLDNYNAALQKNTEEYELDTKRRILARTEELLAADGLSQAEKDYLLQMGLNMGVYTEDYVLQAGDVLRESQAMADAFADLDGTHVNVYVTTWLESILKNGNFGSGLRPPPEHAAGGRVRANEEIIIGERGPERFVPDQPGEIIPNSSFSAGGGFGGGGGATITQNIIYSPQISFGDRDELMEFFIPLVEDANRLLAGDV